MKMSAREFGCLRSPSTRGPRIASMAPWFMPRLFENLGMEPVIVLVPGHAYVGVRVAASPIAYLYIETSLTGRTSFDVAVASASRTMAKFSPSQFIRVDIRQARLDGYLPDAADDIDARNPVLDASSPECNSRFLTQPLLSIVPSNERSQRPVSSWRESGRTQSISSDKSGLTCGRRGPKIPLTSSPRR